MMYFFIQKNYMLCQKLRVLFWCSSGRGPIVTEALTKCSNGSAPGVSGIIYKMLKPIICQSMDWWVKLFNNIIKQGYQPTLWWKAKVIIIPKPNKKDYFISKAYNLIQLQECASKILEKFITKQLYKVIRIEIPVQQFGAQKERGVNDAMTLAQTFIYDNINWRLKVSMMCMDIDGFFSSIPITWMVKELNCIDVSTGICRWLFSFLTDHQVSIAFNN